MSNPMCKNCKGSVDVPAKECETPDECVESCLQTYLGGEDSEKKSVSKITKKGPSGIVRK